MLNQIHFTTIYIFCWDIKILQVTIPRLSETFVINYTYFSIKIL